MIIDKTLLDEANSLKPIKSIWELHRLAKVSKIHKYWFHWTVSNLAGPAPELGLNEAYNWVLAAAIQDGLNEEAFLEEANFCLDSVKEEWASNQLQFKV